MKFDEKYNHKIEIPEDALNEAQKLALNVIMKEGELLYRERLISLLKLGEKSGISSYTANALIQFLETDDTDDEASN